jgi:hypothetical protein
MPKIDKMSHKVSREGTLSRHKFLYGLCNFKTKKYRDLTTSRTDPNVEKMNEHQLTDQKIAEEMNMIKKL